MLALLRDLASNHLHGTQHAQAPHPAHAHTHGHAHAHGHEHHHGPAKPTPGHALTHNPLDADGFSEICACCQGAVDLDELMTLKAAAPHQGHPGQHSHWGLHLPHGATETTIAALTVWASVPGIYFGVQNHRNAHRNVGELDKARRMLMLEGHSNAAAASATNPQLGSEPKLNVAAYIDTIEQSRSMQRFISVFAGLLPLAGSTCILASVVAPVLGVVGCGFLSVYCVSHTVRYLTFEWRRVRKLEELMAPAKDFEPSRLSAEVRLGLEASERLLAERKTLYPQVASAFALYAAGAVALQVSTVVAPAVFAPFGALAIGFGMPAVLYYNNGPIKNAYNKNGDRNINRLMCGTQTDIAERIGSLGQEASALKLLQQSTQEALRAQPRNVETLKLQLALGVRLGVSYGLTFGICTLGRDHAWQALRHNRLRALPHAHVLVRAHEGRMGVEPKDTDVAPEQALYELLYARPEKLAHERGALLDHFHARVHAEGLKLAAA